jgi:hypothetical protein
MVRNGHSVILFPNWLLSNITYGTKFQFWYTMTNSYHIEIEYHYDQFVYIFIMVKFVSPVVDIWMFWNVWIEFNSLLWFVAILFFSVIGVSQALIFSRESHAFFCFYKYFLHYLMDDSLNTNYTEKQNCNKS